MSAAPAPVQPSLFDMLPAIEPIKRVPAPGNGAVQTIEQRFAAFDEANPSVYALLRGLALGMKGRGAKRWSTKAAFEIVRWAYFMQTTDPEGYKLNNNYTALYARKLMDNEPQLAGFFETRGDHDGSED